MQKIEVHKDIKNPGIYAIYNMESKIYVRNTDETAKNGIIVLVNRGDKI